MKLHQKRVWMHRWCVCMYDVAYICAIVRYDIWNAVIIRLRMNTNEKKKEEEKNNPGTEWNEGKTNILVLMNQMKVQRSIIETIQ